MARDIEALKAKAVAEAKERAEAAKAKAREKKKAELAAIPLPGEEKKKPPPAMPFKTPDALWRKMKEYFEHCEQENDGAGVFPDEAGMRIFLKLGHESYRSYREDPEYQKVFDWAMDMRESWLARRLASEPRMSQAYLNALKQPSNGGWVDRKADTGDKTLRLKLDGIGGEEAGR